MYTIAKEFRFSASHQLYNLPDTHPCARLHGHNYVVTVYLQRATLDTVGFVIDYNALRPLADYIADHFDHRHLNDVGEMAGKNTTAENLAYIFYAFCKNRWPETCAVEVKETEKTCARYER